MFERLGESIKRAFGLDSLVANLVFLALTSFLAIALHAIAGIPVAYLIAGGVVLFLLLVAGWLQYTKAHLKWMNRKRAEAQAPLVPEPHDPLKDYSARAEHEVRWQGRFRHIRATLHDVGNGWDRGVRLEVEFPSGEVRNIHEWQDLSVRAMQREVAEKGDGVEAEPAGPYILRWRSVPLPQYLSEIVAEETIPLDPTGPLEDWVAEHQGLEARFVLRVRHINGERGSPLQGFRCNVIAPGDEFMADDRDRELKMGIIQFGEFPTPKTQGQFFFPNEFEDAPERRDLRDGEYTVFWTGWRPDPSGDWLESEWVDVARDTFKVLRNGQII